MNLMILFFATFVITTNLLHIKCGVLKDNDNSSAEPSNQNTSKNDGQHSSNPSMPQLVPVHVLPPLNGAMISFSYCGSLEPNTKINICMEVVSEMNDTPVSNIAINPNEMSNANHEDLAACVQSPNPKTELEFNANSAPSLSMKCPSMIISGEKNSKSNDLNVESIEGEGHKADEMTKIDMLRNSNSREKYKEEIGDEENRQEVVVPEFYLEGNNDQTITVKDSSGNYIQAIDKIKIPAIVNLSEEEKISNSSHANDEDGKKIEAVQSEPVVSNQVDEANPLDTNNKLEDTIGNTSSSESEENLSNDDNSSTDYSEESNHNNEQQTKIESKNNQKHLSNSTELTDQDNADGEQVSGEEDDNSVSSESADPFEKVNAEYKHDETIKNIRDVPVNTQLEDKLNDNDEKNETTETNYNEPAADLSDYDSESDENNEQKEIEKKGIKQDQSGSSEDTDEDDKSIEEEKTEDQTISTPADGSYGMEVGQEKDGGTNISISTQPADKVNADKTEQNDNKLSPNAEVIQKDDDDLVITPHKSNDSNEGEEQIEEDIVQYYLNSDKRGSKMDANDEVDTTITRNDDLNPPITTQLADQINDDGRHAKKIERSAAETTITPSVDPADSDNELIADNKTIEKKDSNLVLSNSEDILSNVSDESTNDDALEDNLILPTLTQPTDEINRDVHKEENAGKNGLINNLRDNEEKYDKIEDEEIMYGPHLPTTTTAESKSSPNALDKEQNKTNEISASLHSVDQTSNKKPEFTMSEKSNEQKKPWVMSFFN